MILFLPKWQAILGPVTRRGEGLLARDLSPFKDGLDELRIFCGTFQIVVKPKLGQIFLDGQLMSNMEPPCGLLWFRRMSLELGTHDKNSRKPQCSFYGIGLEKCGLKEGYRLTEDGKAHWSSLT